MERVARHLPRFQLAEKHSRQVPAAPARVLGMAASGLIRRRLLRRVHAAALSRWS